MQSKLRGSLLIKEMTACLWLVYQSAYWSVSIHLAVLLSCFIRYSTRSPRYKAQTRHQHLHTNNPRIRWLIYLHSFPFISVWESLLHAPVIYRHIESTFPCCYYVPHTHEAGDGRTKLKNNQCIKSHDHLREDEVDENVI